MPQRVCAANAKLARFPASARRILLSQWNDNTIFAVAFLLRIWFSCAAAKDGGGTRTSDSHLFGVLGTFQSITHKGTCMKSAIVLKVAAVAVVIGLVGCTDLKPLQAEVADLKSQVGKLQSDVASAKQSADQANSAAQSASQAASGAQSTANQALAASQASQSCCDATNEKIDRMFRRSVSK
jgi:hypothetical protein